MKAITIKQPFASLIIEGYKKYEFRTWKTNFRGKILIHAGLGKDEKNVQRFKYLNIVFPYGAIIGEAQITDCIEVTDELIDKLTNEDSEVYKESGYGAKYAFKIENIKKYANPIPCKGALSFWTYNEK